MLAAIFALPDYFPLLDEPTNHLDQEGRQQAATYLHKKRLVLLLPATIKPS